VCSWKHRHRLEHHGQEAAAVQLSRVDEERLVSAHSCRLAQAGLRSGTGSQSWRVVHERGGSGQGEQARECLCEGSADGDHGVGMLRVLCDLPPDRLPDAPLVEIVLDRMLVGVVDPACTAARRPPGDGKATPVVNVHDVRSKLPHQGPAGSFVVPEEERISDVAADPQSLKPLPGLSRASFTGPGVPATTSERPVAQPVAWRQAFRRSCSLLERLHLLSIPGAPRFDAGGAPCVPSPAARKAWIDERHDP
jgi:hypothetical protein